MRLSTILFFGKKPYGFKYRGKHRAAKPIKPLQLATLRNDYERTEQNMLVLRHPYLTVEQSSGHMSHVNKIDKFMDTIYTEKAKKFAKHVTLAERLAHLKVKEAWD